MVAISNTHLSTDGVQRETVDNGWGKLRPLLDPVVVNAPPDPRIWCQLESHIVTWLVNTVSKFPWFNHLTLAGIIYASSGTAHPTKPMSCMHAFLRWAIPERYPDLAALEPEPALVAYYGKPPQPRGVAGASVYNGLQFHVQRHLELLLPQKRAVLAPFLFPRLTYSPRLISLRKIVNDASRRSRKDQTFAVVKELASLVALGKKRYRWLADLEARVQKVVASVKEGEIVLPALISVNDLDGQHEVVFRVWDHLRWLEHHRQAYNKESLRYAKTTSASRPHRGVFLQLIGDLPENSWFLRAIALGLLQGPNAASPEGRKYLQSLNLPSVQSRSHPGLLASDHGMGRTMFYARRVATGTPDDSKILFCVEPLLAAATVGLFTLVSIVSTGMRIGELQQVTLDRSCMVYGHLPEFDDKTSDWVKGTKRLYWLLYPKGAKGQRERYLVTPAMTEALFVMLDLHSRYYGEGSIKPVRATTSVFFKHSRRFPGKYKFVLQWTGKQIPMQVIHKCLDVLLLGHLCRGLDGKPVRITPHILRHGVAGWLRKQGIPLDEIMALLKQVNITVTEYYSKLSPEDLHHQLGPALTALAELAETDPATIRTVGDLQTLAQDALKRYGALRHTPGGVCTVFTPCQVQFQCASCPYYVPDPARRSEVHEKIASHSKVVHMYGELGDYLQAEVAQAHLRDWKRILKEMNALDEVQLVSPIAEVVLKNLEADDLGDVLLRNLDDFKGLPPEGAALDA